MRLPGNTVSDTEETESCYFYSQIHAFPGAAGMEYGGFLLEANVGRNAWAKEKKRFVRCGGLQRLRFFRLLFKSRGEHGGIWTLKYTG